MAGCLSQPFPFSRNPHGKGRGTSQKSRACPNKPWQCPGLDTHLSAMSHGTAASTLEQDCFLLPLTDTCRGKGFISKAAHTHSCCCCCPQFTTTFLPQQQFVGICQYFAGLRPLVDMSPFSWQKRSAAQNRSEGNRCTFNVCRELCQQRAQDFPFWLMCNCLID